MLKRFFILTLPFILLLIWAYMHPFKPPKVPMDNRYTKIAKDGTLMNAWQGPWQCVKDSKSGLIWEVKSVNEDIHDEQSTFSWFNVDKGVKRAGNCFVGSEYCDTSDIIKRTNEEKLCGISSWRLPTIKELQTLLKQDVRPGEALIDTSFFLYTKRAPYWSLESDKKLFGIYKRHKRGALSLNFQNAIVKALPYSSTCFVRLVSDISSSNNESH